jgi:hypothetical protein
VQLRADVEAERRHQAEPISPSCRRGLVHELGASARVEALQQGGVAGQQRARAWLVTGGAGSREIVVARQLLLRRTLSQQVVSDVAVTGVHRGCVWRAPIAAAGLVDWRAVRDQQSHPSEEVPARRGAEFLDEQLLRAVEAVAEALVPWATAILAEAMLEQQFEVIVTGMEVTVVERLAVVRVGAGVEQEARQRMRMCVRRLVVAVLAFAEGTGQGRKRRYIAMPEEAGIRVGAVRQQGPCRCQGRVLGVHGIQAGVAGVEQRLPAVRTAALVHQGRVGGEMGFERQHVASDRGGEHIGAFELPMRGEQGASSLQPLRPPIAVHQAGVAKELICRRFAAGLVRGRRWPPGEPLHQFQVLPQPRPTGEAVGSRHDELRVSEGEAWQCSVRARMQSGGLGEGSGISGEHLPKQAPRLLAQVFERRVLGKGMRRHSDLLPANRGSVGLGPQLRRGSALARDGRTFRLGLALSAVRGRAGRQSWSLADSSRSSSGPAQVLRCGSRR